MAWRSVFPPRLIQVTEALMLAQSALTLAAPSELAESLSTPLSAPASGPSEISVPSRSQLSSGLLNRHHRIWSARTRRQEETDKANAAVADRRAKVAQHRTTSKRLYASHYEN